MRFGERQIFKLEGVRKWTKSQISISVPSRILELYEITVQIYYMVTKLYFGGSINFVQGSQSKQRQNNGQSCDLIMIV